MTKHQANFFNFINWLTQKYIKLEKQTLPYPCKVIKVISKNNQKIVQIQLAGQSHIIEADSRKIIEENLFQYFSPTDIKKLFELAYDKRQLTFSDQYYCEETKKEMLVFTDPAGNKISLAAQAVSFDEEFIKNINSADAHRVGFISGIEYIKKIFRK